MDERLLDDLSRLLAREHSRRAMVRGLVGGALVSLVPGLRPPAVAAERCAKVGKKCDQGKRCCKGARCRKGRCRCKNGLASCNRRCRDLQTDAGFCGSCETACLPDQSCLAGQCKCPPNKPTLCGDACVNLDTDRNNCGECDETCPSTPSVELCRDGACCIQLGNDCHVILNDRCCPDTNCELVDTDGNGRCEARAD